MMTTLQNNLTTQIFTLLIVSFFIGVSNVGANNPQCYDLIWSDEFSGNTLDQNKWQYYTWGWNASNVQNCYRQDNVEVNNGTLKLTARYEPGVTCDTGGDFSSGFVETRDKASWTYGYFEARIKLPASNSTWPSFWMSPQDSEYGDWPRSGEVDVFEVKGHDMTRSYGNAHWGNSESDRQQEKGTYTFSAGNTADDWHIYAVEWSEGELKFFIDDVHYHTINNFDEPNAAVHPGPFDKDFFLRLNVAVGGTYLDAPWDNAYNAINQLPATMEVDWVRVYQKNDNCNPDSDPNSTECNMIQNPDFSAGYSAWETYISSSANASLSTNAGYADYMITNGSTSKYKVQLYQTGLLLEQGKTYEVSFRASADANKAIYVQFSDQSNPPTQYHYQDFNVGTSWATQSFTFSMSNTTNTNARINFGVGSNSIDIAFDDVLVKEADCNSPILGCTTSCAPNYNPTAEEDDGSCEACPPPPNTCNSNARLANPVKVVVEGTFAIFAQSSFTNNFIKAEKAYIKHQKEIHEILNSKERQYAKVVADFDAVKGIALSLLYNSFTKFNNAETVSSTNLQYLNEFLMSLHKATKSKSLKDEIKNIQKYMHVMDGKEVKKALVDFDNANEEDTKDASEINDTMEEDFIAQISNTQGKDVFLNYQSTISGVVDITLYDLEGRKLSQSFNQTIHTGFYQYALSKQNLSKGIYYVQVNFKAVDGKLMNKILKLLIA